MRSHFRLSHLLGSAGVLFLLGASPETRTGETIWQLGPVHGTAAEVAHQVNGEVERLTRRHSELQSSIAEENANSERLRAARLAIVHATPEYKSQAATADTTLSELNDARKAHSTDAMEISGRLNHVRASMANLEKIALKADDPFQQSLRFTSGYAVDLKKTDEALVGARKWREDVVAGIEGSFYLKWPLTEGKVGLLFETTDVEPAGSGSRFFSSSAEWGKVISTTESIKKLYLTPHPFIGRLAHGQPTAHGVYQVESFDDDTPQHVRLVELPDSEIARLWNAIDKKP